MSRTWELEFRSQDGKRRCEPVGLSHRNNLAGGIVSPRVIDNEYKQNNFTTTTTTRRTNGGCRLLGAVTSAFLRFLGCEQQRTKNQCDSCILSLAQHNVSLRPPGRLIIHYSLRHGRRTVNGNFLCFYPCCVILLREVRFLWRAVW